MTVQQPFKVLQGLSEKQHHRLGDPLAKGPKPTIRCSQGTLSSHCAAARPGMLAGTDGVFCRPSAEVDQKFGLHRACVIKRRRSWAGHGNHYWRCPGQDRFAALAAPQRFRDRARAPSVPRGVTGRGGASLRFGKRST